MLVLSIYVYIFCTLACILYPFVLLYCKYVKMYMKEETLSGKMTCCLDIGFCHGLSVSRKEYRVTKMSHYTTV